jgi:hypothetical protein
VESTHDVTKVINDLSLLDENSAATASQLITENDMTPRNLRVSFIVKKMPKIGNYFPYSIIYCVKIYMYSSVHDISLNLSNLHMM